jgi:hypothetical protein
LRDLGRNQMGKESSLLTSSVNRVKPGWVPPYPGLPVRVGNLGKAGWPWAEENGLRVLKKIGKERNGSWAGIKAAGLR